MIARKHLVHAIRVGILVCIVVLMRLQQVAILTSAPSIDVLDIDNVTLLFPTARSLQPNSDGRVDVLSETKELLGYVLQTSPDCDHIVGFSGPTNVLIALSPDEEVVGLRVLSSGDTRDHVRQVVSDNRFMQSLNSLGVEEARALEYDAVTGATLTSLAIRESIACRLGNRETKSLRFPEPPSLSAIQTLFTECERIEEIADSSVFNVFDISGSEVGTVLRTAPAADNTVGYQGPTEAVIGFDANNNVVGVAIGNSYDNEPYVGYVRDDSYFLAVFNDLNLDALAEFDLMENQIEGVSGATMTSLAVAEGVVLAAKARSSAMEAREANASPSFFERWSVHDFGTVICAIVGVLIGLTRLRANRKLGFVWNIVLVGYVGLIAGSLLSQAMFIGWAKNGIPIGSGFGLLLLTIAALSIPIATRRNIYCTHLCPHGAAQQILKNRLPWRAKLSPRMRASLRLIPAALLLWCVIVGMSSLGFSLVDIEPFDAYVFRIAGYATIAVAVVGLVASIFIPMAYCRFGCPTGALLEFLRFNSRADRWTIRDWVATCCLVVAAAMYVVG